MYSPRAWWVGVIVDAAGCFVFSAWRPLAGWPSAGCRWLNGVRLDRREKRHPPAFHRPSLRPPSPLRCLLPATLLRSEKCGCDSQFSFLGGWALRPTDNQVEEKIIKPHRQSNKTTRQEAYERLVAYPKRENPSPNPPFDPHTKTGSH